MLLPEASLGEIMISFSYLFLPFASAYICKALKKDRLFSDLLFSSFLFIGVGVQGVLTGIIQIIAPEIVVSYVGWPLSPFILELGMANLSYGILGIISPWLDPGWKNATGIGYSLFLIFTGLGHVIDIFSHGLSPSNFGGFLFTDLLIPIIIFALIKYRKHDSSRRISSS
jgi:hypothetical protein